VEVAAVVVPPISVHHTVVAGDTLAKIAASFRTTPTVLLALNDIADPNILALGQVLLIGESEGVARPPDAPFLSDLVEAQIVSVDDGNIIQIRLADGSADSVRYLGIDTPVGADPFRARAADRNAQLLSGGTVFLESDVSDRDRFSRLLRYVWVQDVTGRFLLINATLVAEGFAQASPVESDVKHRELLVDLEDAARAIGIGQWAEIVDDGGNCSPAYPSLCIPPPPPDLDCGQIPFRQFTVLPPDPHLFDGNLDGVGCDA
jgi:micrococcal nuclease